MQNAAVLDATLVFANHLLARTMKFQYNETLSIMGEINVNKL